MSDSEEDGASSMLCAFCGHGKDVEDICGTLYTEKLKTTHLAAHKKCMQYSSGLDQHNHTRFGGFYLENVKNEIKRGKRLKCCACKLTKKNGATSGCELKACRRSFHFYCAHQHPHSRTCRRKLRDTGEHLYWVFCSEEHREEYLKTDQGKQEESCSETDDEADDEGDDEADDEDDDEDDKPLVKIKESCSEATDKDDDDEDDKPLVKIKESCSEAADEDKDDDDEDDTSEDQDHAQGNTVDKGLPMTPSECSEHSEPEIWVYTEGSSVSYDTGHSSGSFGSNLDALFPSVIGQRDGLPSATAGPAHTSAASERVGRKKKKQVKRPATHDERKQVRRPATHDKTKHRDSSNSRRDKGNRDRKKKKPVKRQATDDETKHHDSSSSKRDKGNGDRKKKKAVKRLATHDETKHHDSSSSKRDKGNGDRKKKKAVKRLATHDETKHHDSSSSKRDKGNGDRKKKKAVKRLATHDETKHHDSSSSKRDKGNRDWKKKKAVKRPATDDETKHVKKLATNDETKKVKRLATDEETKHRDSSSGKRQKGNIQRKKSQKQKWKANCENGKQNAGSNDSIQNLEPIIISSDESEENRKQVAGLDNVEEASQQDGAPVIAQTTSLSKMPVSSKDENCRAVEPGRHCLRKHQRNLPSPGWESLFCDSPRSSHPSGKASEQQEQETSGDMVSVVYPEPETSGDLVSVVYPEPETSGDLVSEVYPEPETSGDLVSVVYHEPETSGDLVSEVYPEPETSGDLVSVVYPEPETSGDLVSVVHPEPETSGDLVSVVHPEPETSGDLVSVVHGEPETSGDMVPDSTVCATACRTQAMACADVDAREVDEERRETALSDGEDLGLVLPTSVQDSSECLLVIPEDHRGFEGVKERLQEKLAHDFGIRVQHVHLWDSLHPWDLLPSEGILAYFQQIATAVMKKNWEELEELLLSVGRVQQGGETAHTKAKDCRWLIKERRQQSKEDLRKVIEVTLCRARQKNQYMMGLFCCSFTPCYISFFINNICDPQQNVRCALHHSRVHALSPDAVRLPSFHTLSPQHLDHYMQLEFDILHHWLKRRFPKHTYRVTCVPEDHMLRLGPDESPRVFHELKCELDADSSYSPGVPVIVFMCRIKTSLIHFDSYLQACLSHYAKCFSNLHVACIFPVDNLDGRWTCPQLDLDSPDCMVKTFSAFCPSRRPVTVLVVELSRAEETC